MDDVMNYNDIFEHFSERISQIIFYQRTVHDSTYNQEKALFDYKKSITKSKHVDISEIHNMFFRCPTSGKDIFYGKKAFNIEERIRNIHEYKNKYYQWLLVEAYEQYEDFLEKTYAFIGYKDNGFWKLQDYGNITLTELQDRDFDWFIKRASKVKDPFEIHKLLENRYVELRKKEGTNHYKLDLYFIVRLVEKIRHIIVHKEGRVGSREEFIELVSKAVGQYNNGNTPSNITSIINSFFCEKDTLCNTIYLTQQSKCCGVSNNSLQQLCDCLLAEAFIITNEVIAEFN